MPWLLELEGLVWEGHREEEVGPRNTLTHNPLVPTPPGNPGKGHGEDRDKREGRWQREVQRF